MDAQELTLFIGGKWYRRFGAAPCPVCQPDRRKWQNALTISDGNDGRLLLNCKKSACDFRDITTAAGVTPGSYTPPDRQTLAQRVAERKADTAKREHQARAIWDETLPIVGTPAETYLRGRGITCPPPETLRFHPDCWHGPTATRHPAMVALVQGGEGFSMHRTYLQSDGTGKAGLAGGDKLMLGAVSGGAVRLSQTHSHLVVAEGIESALSLLCGLLDGPVTVWAALSTSGVRGLRLPAQPTRLTVAADGDTPGRDAAHSLAERAHATGWKVGLLDPGDGADWNDILTGKAVAE